jgi:hypothetical protein
MQLETKLRLVGDRKGRACMRRPWNIESPFSLDPAVRILVIIFETWIQRFSASSLELALLVINDDSRDFRIAPNGFLTREPTKNPG